jgi:hypothetical protein
VVASLELLWVLLVVLYLADALLLCEPGDTVIVGWRPGSARVGKGFEISLGRPRVVAWGGLLPPLDPPLVVGGRRLDADVVAHRYERMASALRPVRVLTQVLFVLVFVLLPGAIYAPSGWYTPSSMFSLIGVCWAALALTTLRAARGVYANGDSRPSLTATLLSPVSAVRVVDTLVKRFAWEWHPVVVARHLCRREDYLALARAACFATPVSEAEPLVAFLRSAGDWDAVSAPPELEEGCTSFCPACHAQFREGVERCPDCDVRLLATAPGVLTRSPHPQATA